MRRWRAVPVLAGLAALAGPVPLAAQVPAESQLPGIPLSARNASLAGASVAMVGYAGSIFTSPAGIAPIKILSLEGGFSTLSDTTTYFMGAAAVRLGPLNLGGGARYLRFDPGLAVYDNLETVLGATARIRGVAIGLAGNYFSVSDSGGVTTRAMTADASVMVAFFDIAALALSVQNIGKIPIAGTLLDIPSATRLGLSLNLIDTYSNGRLLFTVEQVWSEGDARTLFGLEGGFVLYGVGIMARFGAGARPAGSPYGSPTWGGSVVLGRGALDYAYLRRPGMDPVHMFGFRLTP